jgi:hypothetical protein
MVPPALKSSVYNPRRRVKSVFARPAAAYLGAEAGARNSVPRSAVESSSWNRRHAVAHREANEMSGKMIWADVRVGLPG